MIEKSDRKELERRLEQAKRAAALGNDPVTTERLQKLVKDLEEQFGSRSRSTLSIGPAGAVPCQCGSSSPSCRTICLRVRFSSLMADVLDDPEPCTSRQARAAGQHAESRPKPCVRHLRQSGLLSQHRIGRQPFSG